MATCSEINADAPNKSKLEETQSKEITVNFGIFFDGTNNQRLQVAMGKLNREKNAEKKKEKIKNIIASLDGTFDENQYEKNGSIQYSFKNNPPSNKEKEIEKLNKKIAKYNKKYGNRLDDNERDTVESFVWDDASGKKKDGETNQEAIKRKSGIRLGMPRSYMQGVDFTNIARLEPLYDFNQNDATTYKYRIYVSGSGTFADVNKGMDISGLAFGQGSAGVVQKVKDALDALVDKIKGIKDNSNIKEVNYKFNVFGFSRGATEARLFIDLLSNKRARKRHDILNNIISEYNKVLIDKEDNANISFPKLKTLEFPFVGLFDTVSSVGMTPGIWNSAIAAEITKGIENISSTASKFHEKNKEELGLDTLVYDDKVKHIVHICALDEFRENFALQVMPTNNSKVEQFFMPGIHTDIGGGDLDGYDEEKYIAKTHKNIVLYIPKIVTPGERQKKSDLFIINKENLQQLGWIKESTNSSLMSDIAKEEKDIIKIQKYSEHGYAYLPLTILAKKACEHTCKFDTLEDKYCIPKDLPKSFGAMKAAWEGKDSKYGHCYYPTKDFQYKELRQKYLHFSSNIKKTAGLVYVNGPNLTKSNDNEDSVSYYDRFLDYQQPQGWYGKITNSGILDITFEKTGNLNNDDYLGEAVVIIQDSQKPLVIEKTTPQQLRIDDNTKKLFLKYGYSIESDGVLKRIAVGRIPDTKNTTIYGTNGKIKVFDGITTPYDVTKYNTILEGHYKAKKYQMPSKGAYTKQVHDKDKECKTYLISKENGYPPEGTNNGTTKQMSGVYIHRSDGDGIAYKQYEYQKGDNTILLEIGSSQGCLVIDQRQYADVELLLKDSQDIFISINRT